VGYRHPHVMAAVRRSSTRCPSPRRFTNAAAVDLASARGLAPDPSARCCSRPADARDRDGAEACAARHGPAQDASLWDSFHGASLDAISIGGEAVFRKDIGPLMPGTSTHRPAIRVHVASAAAAHATPGAPSISITCSARKRTSAP
jgi:4-aminobutyrate aminotransferase